MRSHNSTYFRLNMMSILEYCESGGPVMITTNKGVDTQQRMIVMSEAEYDKMNNKIKGDK